MNSKASLATLFATCCLFAIASAAYPQASLSELPIGHLKITEGENGTINVEARCVPTKDLLETIAQRTGMPITFDRPCLTYVSVWKLGEFNLPAHWLQYIVLMGSAAEASVSPENGAWRVRSLETPQYDASLDESAIVSKFSTSATAPVQPSTGISSALFIYDGRFFPPPYKIDFVTNADSSCDVTVNDVPVCHVSGPPSAGVVVPDLPPSGQFEDPEALFRYVYRWLYKQFLAEGTPDDAVAQVVKFLAGQNIVEEVATKENPGSVKLPQPWPGGPVYVRFKGEKRAVPVFVTNFDFQTGEVVATSRGNVSPEERAAIYAAHLSTRLGRGEVVIEGKDCGGFGSGGGSAAIATFLGALDTAQGLSLGQRECVFGEMGMNRPLARKLAVNLPPDSESLANALRELLSGHPDGPSPGPSDAAVDIAVRNLGGESK